MPDATYDASEARRALALLNFAEAMFTTLARISSGHFDDKSRLHAQAECLEALAYRAANMLGPDSPELVIEAVASETEGTIAYRGFYRPSVISGSTPTWKRRFGNGWWNMYGTPTEYLKDPGVGHYELPQ